VETIKTRATARLIGSPKGFQEGWMTFNKASNVPSFSSRRAVIEAHRLAKPICKANTVPRYASAMVMHGDAKCIAGVVTRHGEMRKLLFSPIQLQTAPLFL
jgi:hypothetical protein